MDLLRNFIFVAQESLTPGGGAPPASSPGGPTQGAPGQAPGFGFDQILFILVMLAIFYFLLIRPQQKRAKKHQQLIGSLKKGDNVITSSGIFGRIVAIEGNTLTLEIAKNTQIKVLKGYVGGLANPETEKELATPQAT